MNIMKDHADFSSCIIFEASGDSEAYCDNMMGGYIYEDDNDLDYDNDDDALSCCYDGSDICNAADEFNMYGEPCDDADDRKEVEGGASYCEDDEIHKSYVSSDSSQKFMDEMEKNRLFWEACLAS
ncbi:hypothetical protein Lal_00000247 [Lupinus albus]|uniref:Uncharacterized protein n=1 Tax=Lupinus albus TaxID=3870 RepID=A0A6A5LM39_LUPAL|nr:hypothetical protein Lalb_Chr21g0306691 [Lupinus albus]KAF1860833.1 hypothetical protein Lal_00000247 [Lupinus albus]